METSDHRGCNFDARIYIYMCVCVKLYTIRVIHRTRCETGEFMNIQKVGGVTVATRPDGIGRGRGFHLFIFHRVSTYSRWGNVISTFVRVLIFIIQREKASRKKWTMRGDFFLSSKFLSLPYISVPLLLRARTQTQTCRRHRDVFNGITRTSGFQAGLQAGWWLGSSASVPFRVD